MSFLAITLPVSIAVAAILVGIVIWALLDGAFDDWEGPAARHHFDDDATPEYEPGLPEPLPAREAPRVGSKDAPQAAGSRTRATSPSSRAS